MMTDTQAAEWRKLHLGGMSINRIAQEAGVDRHRVSRAIGGSVHRRKRRARPPVNLHINRDAMKKAAAVAKKYGYTLTAGETFGQGSVGQLVEAIGDGEVIVVPAASFAEIRRKAACWDDPSLCAGT